MVNQAISLCIIHYNLLFYNRRNAIDYYIASLIRRIHPIGRFVFKGILLYFRAGFLVNILFIYK